MEDIETLIDAIGQQDFVNANNMFNELIADRMTAALDQEKIAVAGQIFNGVEVTDEEDEQLELADDDLDDTEEDDDFSDEEIEDTLEEIEDDE